ncbi:unnamed protein product [Linum trigynum]|uniref:Gnk2-homologous domain-containing protein n=1 Tax=Linum trigynum TaxID=586398 RepID=A0AAV2GFC0_9ROSI
MAAAIATLLIVVVVVLLGTGTNDFAAADDSPGYVCNGEQYKADMGPAFEACVRSLAGVVSQATGRVTEGECGVDPPTVVFYGRAFCDSRVTDWDCILCQREIAPWLLHPFCTGTVGSTLYYTNCEVRYEIYPF